MRKLTPKYIIKLFEGVMDCQTPTDWEHNKERFIELIEEYGQQQVNNTKIKIVDYENNNRT